MIALTVRMVACAWRMLQIRRNPVKYARSLGVTIGDGCWVLSQDTGMFGSEPYLVTIGSNVCITDGVRFITHDGAVTPFRGEYPKLDIVAPIRVGNDVFIGMRTLILPGVSIGDRCIVGAGSVVTRDIPSGSVVVGVPARIISTYDEYLRKTLGKSIQTGDLLPTDKRRVLTERFRHVG
ncbi:MAG: putative Glycosyl transferase [Schlesneria sp.]|nr:putative Glycosyl transferase [Schlesneria sp.]